MLGVKSNWGVLFNLVKWSFEIIIFFVDKFDIRILIDRLTVIKKERDGPLAERLKIFLNRLFLFLNS